MDQGVSAVEEQGSGDASDGDSPVAIVHGSWQSCHTHRGDEFGGCFFVFNPAWIGWVEGQRRVGTFRDRVFGEVSPFEFLELFFEVPRFACDGIRVLRIGGSIFDGCEFDLGFQVSDGFVIGSLGRQGLDDR